MEPATYKIVRMFHDSGRHHTIRRGLTLEQAEKWCRDPETHSATCSRQKNRTRTALCGQWFDGYEAEGGRR